jgi:hypothetical protein
MRKILPAPIVAFLAMLLGPVPSQALQPPPWLPRYQLAINLDVDGHNVAVTQHVTWINRHELPATELVFNVHSAFAPPHQGIKFLMLSKMLEIMRVPGREGIYSGRPCKILKTHLFRPKGNTIEKVELPFEFREDLPTALVIPLPMAVKKGESITLAIDFALQLPEKQGRWGQWKGVTFLSNWIPILAFYDELGWHPTPFVAWHQPWFNEAGLFDVQVRLRADQKIACTGGIRQRVENGDLQDVWIGPVAARDFSFICSAQFEEYVADPGPSGVKVKCLAFPAHEFYGRAIAKISARAVEQYTQWFGPLPYPELTLVESYFGWNGNECSDLIMIDERVFGMPHVAEGYVEYLVSHETCHQWWYNIIGTDGYRETFMDEAFVVFFTHKYLDKTRGKNNPMMKYPEGLEWLPNIYRENYRYSSFYNTVGRDELGPALQDMANYRHVGNLFAACYDRGGKIVGTIEDRLGEAAFLDFSRHIFEKYYFQVIRAKDYQRELEEYTGKDWSGFCDRWLRTNGLVDWAVDSVDLQKLKGEAPKPRVENDFLAALRPDNRTPYQAVVYLKQKGDFDEPTWLGFSFDGNETFTMKIPIDPAAGLVELQDPPARIEPTDDKRIRVEILLPSKPTQIAVDPDQVLAEKDPANNYWKPRFRVRVTPLYTFIDESAMTAAYDRWNVTMGPWFYEAAYPDPWFTRSTVVGGRVGFYRTEQFNGGVYVGYRPDFRDTAVGVDWQWINPLFPKTSIGFDAEKALVKFDGATSDLDKVMLYTRYTFMQTASMYAAPIHYAEMFTSWQHNILPYARQNIPGTERFDERSNVGIHYHIDLLTPYWNPEVGFKFDTTYAAGFPVLGQTQFSNQLTAQLSWIVPIPDGFGYLSDTRFAFRVYGAYATPNNALMFSLGGNTLFRGFDLKERQGNAMFVGSAEWRLPVYRQIETDVVDHVVGLRGLYLAPFYDAGDMYVLNHTEGGVAHALGVGLRADVAWFSFLERTMLRLDIAKTVNASSATQFWFGISHPF